MTPDALDFTDRGDFVRWVTVPGRGKPVFYLHGLGCHGGSSWTGTAVRLGRPGIILDLPGHGRSDRPRDIDYSLPVMADAVARVIDRVTDGAPADIVSHSLGGSIAIVLAATRPDLVRASLLVEPAIDPVPIKPGDIAAHSDEELLSGGWQRILEAELDWRRCDMQLADPIAIRRLAAALCDAMGGTLHDQLRETIVPATLVRGEVRTYERADEFVTAGIKDELVVGAQHFVMWDRPDALDAILRRAFEEADR